MNDSQALIVQGLLLAAVGNIVSQHKIPAGEFHVQFAWVDGSGNGHDVVVHSANPRLLEVITGSATARPLPAGGRPFADQARSVMNDSSTEVQGDPDFDDITNAPLDGPSIPLGYDPHTKRNWLAEQQASAGQVGAAGSARVGEDKPVLFTSEDPQVEQFLAEQGPLTEDSPDEPLLPEVGPTEGVPPEDPGLIRH